MDTLRLCCNDAHDYLYRLNLKYASPDRRRRSTFLPAGTHGARSDLLWVARRRYVLAGITLAERAGCLVVISDITSRSVAGDDRAGLPGRRTGVSLRRGG